MVESKRYVQFRLRTLLLIVSATAIALGAAHWLGAGVLPFVVADVGIWIAAKSTAEPRVGTRMWIEQTKPCR
jgi:hypothetical protein